MANGLWQGVGQAYNLICEGHVRKIDGESPHTEWSVYRVGDAVRVDIKKKVVVLRERPNSEHS